MIYFHIAQRTKWKTAHNMEHCTAYTVGYKLCGIFYSICNFLSYNVWNFIACGFQRCTLRPKCHYAKCIH